LGCGDRDEKGCGERRQEPEEEGLHIQGDIVDYNSSSVGVIFEEYAATY
jgi:hypothetical protein